MADATISATLPTCCFGMLRQRVCIVPTLRGLIVLAALALLTGGAFVLGIHPFLAVNDPKAGGVLIVEGWVADEQMKLVAHRFDREGYDRLYVTGGPLDFGSFLAGHGTFAEVGRATLLKVGMPEDRVVAVPAPLSRKDRSYAAAVALRRYLVARHGQLPLRVTVATMGSHSRRSRLLFDMALGGEVEVGAMSLPESRFDPDRWWATSHGVKTVLTETFAYLYTKLLFWPGESDAT